MTFKPIAQRSKQNADELDRSVLPVARPKLEPITEIDARKATAPPRFEVKAPNGAPNVVFVLIDNMGDGDPACFGGPVNKYRHLDKSWVLPDFEKLKWAIQSITESTLQ